MRFRSAATVVSIAILWIAAPVRVQAGNDDEVLIGAEASLLAGAVTATVTDAGAIVYNPAGLYFASDDRIDLSGSAIVVRAHNATGLIRSDSGASDDGRFLEIVSIPSALAYARALGPRLRFGVGVFGTRGSAIRILGTLENVVDGRTSHWSAATWQTSSSLTFAGSLAWSRSGRFAVGLSCFLVYDAESAALMLSASRVRPDEIDPTSVRTDGFATLSSIDSYARIGVRTALGVQWIPSRHLRFGASITSPAYSLVASTESSYALEAYDGVGTPTGMHVASTDTGLHWSTGSFLPMRLRLGGALRFDGGYVTLDGDFQPALQKERLGVDRSLVWNLRVGARFAASRDLAVGGGLFTDRSATPLANDVRSGDTRRHFYGFTIGVVHTKRRVLAASENGRSLYFVTTLALRYAFGRGDTSGLRVGSEFEPDLGTNEAVFATVPVAVSTQEITLNIGSAVRF